MYTHCRAHCLNLTIIQSCDQPLIRNRLGTFNEVCNFFRYSPKRSKFSLAVIEKEAFEASKTTLLSLCRTRWVEGHETHEVFFAFLPSTLRALEVMSNKRLFTNQFGETAIYATRCWSATAPKQCRSRDTEGLLQKSAHISFVASSYF